MSLREDHAILQDLSTVSYQPQRLREWCEIAMEVAGRKADSM